MTKAERWLGYICALVIVVLMAPVLVLGSVAGVILNILRAPFHMAVKAELFENDKLNNLCKTINNGFIRAIDFVLDTMCDKILGFT